MELRDGVESDRETPILNKGKVIYTSVGKGKNGGLEEIWGGRRMGSLPGGALSLAISEPVIR